MLQYNSRITVDNGIRFYEQDFLYDDYLYSGDIDITLRLRYANPGFGIALIDNEGNSIINSHTLLFRISNGIFEIIEKNTQNNAVVLFSTSFSQAKPYKEDLLFKIKKRNNSYSFVIGNSELNSISLPVEINTYMLGYYSNKDNIIKEINIAASIPYNWNINMSNTGGGYIFFKRDGFQLIDCKANAEIEQLNIELERGEYYLKYKKEDGSDIQAYIMHSQDDRLSDSEKNILNRNGRFTLQQTTTVSLKFVGTTGSISNICITTESDNDYLRTNIESGPREILGSSIKFLLSDIKYFEFYATVNNVPGMDHYIPHEYSILEIAGNPYGLFDLTISEEVEYKYVYESGVICIYDKNNVKRWSKSVDLNRYVSLFNNVSGIVHDIKIIDLEGNEYYIGVHNEITKYVPGLIKSPIVVLDKDRNDQNAKPLDLSSSYRIIEKENGPYYYFTNVEREYFDPKRRVVLEKLPSTERGSIKIYLIDKDARFDLDKILHIPYKGKDTIMDTIDLCVNGQYLIISEDEYEEFGVVVYRDTGEIIFNTDLSEYSHIIIDYMKKDSYAINFDYERQSYAVDISTDNETVSIVYDNIETVINSYEYINEQSYVNSKIIPAENCYIVIGN